MAQRRSATYPKSHHHEQSWNQTPLNSSTGMAAGGGYRGKRVVHCVLEMSHGEVGGCILVCGDRREHPGQRHVGTVSGRPEDRVRELLHRSNNEKIVDAKKKKKSIIIRR